MHYPKDQLEFDDWFATEEGCLDYLMKIRWPEGVICPKCGCREVWKIESRNLFTCRACRSQISATSGTIFHCSKKLLREWYAALWWIVAQKNGVSAAGLMRILNLGSYRTAWTWLHKFRRLMVTPSRQKLSGTVEVDETYVGGKQSGKRGRGAAGKKLVVIAVELKSYGIGRCRLGPVANASGEELESFVKSNVEPGSTVITDGWSGYNNVGKIGYKHEIEDKTVVFEGDEILPNVHRIAAGLKRWLLGTHQNYCSGDRLAYYLDEFTFRHNRRKSNSRGLLFYRLVEQAVIIEPICYNEL